jgi:DNA modification methylase
MKISISKIKPNPDNPRIIKDDKFKKLVQSLKDFPEMTEVRPIVVNKEMMILGGNMRLKAMQEARWKEVPVTVVDWPEEKQKEFIIKDNSNFGDWDWDTLANEWDEIKLEEWGLDLPELKIDEVKEDDYEIPDEIETDIVKGDLFEIGQHKLLCGDSTISTDVEKLLQGKEPYLMVTDPPYGVDYKPTWRHEAGINNSSRQGNVQNDDRSDWSETWALSPSKVAYIWHAGRHASTVQLSLEKADFEMRSQIIWNKQQMVFSRGDYHWKHEPCWYAVKKGNKGNWAGDRKQTTVWDIQSILQSSKSKKEDEAVFHGTQKPVECMARPIQNHDGDVYDPFLGSGTTMVASHQLNRKCYGIEIDPKYCQIILERMLKLDPSLELRKNGELWETTNKQPSFAKSG